MSLAPTTRDLSMLRDFKAPRFYSFSVLPNSRYEVQVGVESKTPCQATIQSKWAVPMTGKCITPASGK